MHKRILGFLLALLIVFPAVSHAGVIEAVSKRLRDSNNVALTDFAIANGATTYSESIPVADNMGYMAILAIEDKSGGAGNVVITPEYSNDGTNFYDAYTTAAGTLTIDPAIATLTNDTRYIQFTTRLAKFVRLKIVAGAASEVTIDIIWARTR